MKFEIKQAWERASGQLVCHIKVQTKETNAAVKIMDDGTMRIRTYDRTTEDVLFDKELTIGKFVQGDEDGERDGVESFR